VDFNNQYVIANNIKHDKFRYCQKKKIIDLMKDDGFDAATDYVQGLVLKADCSGLSYDLKFDKTKAKTIKYS
jgi:hypothetical protein